MYRKYIKRSLDITLSVTILVITFPLAIITAVLIKLSSKGPILFCQERTGLHGNSFNIYKFRTMTHNNDVHDSSKENQLTSVGKFVRSFSLDEIPQILNILKGEMSFIGPRPWITDYHTYMTEDQRKRVAVLPGITGLAQVHGRNNLSIHDKLNYDLKYVDRISPREDAKIVFLTVKTILNKGGAEIEKLGIHKELTLLREQFALKDELG